MTGKAIYYYEKAAEEAFNSYALEDAITLFKEAQLLGEKDALFCVPRNYLHPSMNTN
jgi:hypothetical protein